MADWIHASCEAMYRDDQAGTAPLAEFLEEYEHDDNVWWMIGSGHHLNLFEAAVEAMENWKTLANELGGVLAQHGAIGTMNPERKRVLARWQEAKK